MNPQLTSRFRHYMTGVAQIDNEHIDLLTAMSDLERSPELTDVEIASQIVTIVQMFEDHLHHEEQFMDSINYPYIEYHKMQHVEILIMLKTYRKSSPDAVTRYATHTLSEHFIAHIDQYDMQLADFVKNHYAKTKDWRSCLLVQSRDDGVLGR